MPTSGPDLIELPVFDETIDELDQLRNIEARCGTVDARTLATVVVNDPLMTLRVLVESARQRSARQSGDTATVTAAVLMMGISRFFEFASRLPRLSQHLPTDSPGAEFLGQALTQARRAATFAAAIALERQDGEAERMQEAALLVDAGLWIACIAHPERSRPVASLLWDEPHPDPHPQDTLIPFRNGALPPSLLPLLDAQTERAILLEPQRRVVLWSRELAWCTAYGWPHLDPTAVQTPVFDGLNGDDPAFLHEATVPNDPSSRHYHHRVLPVLAGLMNRSPLAADAFLRGLDA